MKRLQALSLNKTMMLGLFYKTLLFSFILTSCQDNDSNTFNANIIKEKFPQEVENSFEEYKAGDIGNIKVFKDTLFLPLSYKYSYSCSKFKNNSEVLEKLEELKKFIYLFPTKTREKLKSKIDTMFITKHIIRINDMGQKDTLKGIYENYLFLSEMESFPHEISHVIDKFLKTNDEEWGESIYRENYKEYYKTPVPGSRPLGFITYYAQKSIQEDRAEILRDLMVTHKWRIHPNDKILQIKVTKMKQELFEFDNNFNDQYWEDLKNNVVIDENYWKNKK